MKSHYRCKRFDLCIYRLLLGERCVGNHGFSNSYKIVVVGQNIIHIQYEIHENDKTINIFLIRIVWWLLYKETKSISNGTLFFNLK